MADLLPAVGVLTLLAVIVWLDHDRARAHGRAAYAETELAAAEADLGTAGGGYRRRGVPVLPPAALPAGSIALGQTTGPTTAELHLWLTVTNGMAATVTGRPRHTAEADTCLLDAA